MKNNMTVKTGALWKDYTFTLKNTGKINFLQ